MFLATQLADEARHIDVFLRARARRRRRARRLVGAPPRARCYSLLELEDFTEAAFLLSVLGEGTFLDLLRFIEQHAPDEATARDRAARARRRGAPRPLRHRPRAPRARRTIRRSTRRLEAAVRRRAATLHGAGGVPAPIAGRAHHPGGARDRSPAVARGHEAFRELLDDMHQGRMKRLQTAGFTAEQAQALSDLHTPNFM